MQRVFVSYAFEDREFVLGELVPLLSSGGFHCWHAEGQIRSAQRWEREILVALRDCQWFLLLMSPSSADSEWVKNEVNWAMEYRSGFMIPVLFKDCRAEDFHLGLPRIQFVDYRTDVESARTSLLATLQTPSLEPSPTPVRQSPSAVSPSTHGLSPLRPPKAPFHCGQWVPPDYFVGRSMQLRRAAALIAARQNFLIVGTPRSGKTSLFRKLISQLDAAHQRRTLTSYVNLEQGTEMSVRSFMEHTLLCIVGEMARTVFGCRYSDLLAEHSNEVLDRLSSDPDFVRFNNIFQLVRTYTHGELGRNPSLLIHDFVRFVNELLEICASKAFTSFAMFYDEANRLPRDISVDLLNNIGEALSQTGLIGGYAASPDMGRQFEQLPGLAGNQIEIGPFESEQEMRDLLVRYYFDELQSQLELPIASAAVNDIWSASGGKPYLIQLIANGAFFLAEQQRASQVSPEHVSDAHQLVRRERPEAFV